MNPDRRLLGLQVLRFVAAAMVVSFHTPVEAAILAGTPGYARGWPTVAIGAAGVDIFFVISGFIIALTGPLAEAPPTGWAFFRRRWRRIAPVYWSASLAAMAAAVVWPALRRGGLAGVATPASLGATFLFWPVWGATVTAPYLLVGWTLSLEMLFYSAVSLILVGGRMQRNGAVLAIAVAAIEALRLRWGWVGLSVLVNPMFTEFGAGVALAMIWRRGRFPGPRAGLVLLAFGVLFFAVLAAFPSSWLPHRGAGDLLDWGPAMAGRDFARPLMLGLPATLVVAGTLALESWVRGRSAQAAAWLGDASYSIYLVHVPILLAVAGLFAALGLRSASLAFVLIAFPVAIAGGGLFYAGVEKPLLARLKRRARPGRAEAIA